MNQFTIYIDKDLTPRWNEWPETPNIAAFQSPTVHTDKLVNDYESALQKAKEEAIPFEDPDQATGLIFKMLNDLNYPEAYQYLEEIKTGKLKPDYFISVDCEETVEVVCICNMHRCDGSKKVARLIPSKPEVNSAHSHTEGSEEKHCQNACDWPNCTLPQCVAKSQLEQVIEACAQIVEKVTICGWIRPDDVKTIRFAAGQVRNLDNYPQFKKFSLYPDPVPTIASPNTIVDMQKFGQIEKEFGDVSTPEKPDNSKPDFEAMVQAAFKKDEIGPGWCPTTKRAIMYGMEKLYSDIYLPKVREMDKMSNEITTLLQAQGTQKAYCQKLEDENQELRDKIKTLEEENGALRITSQSFQREIQELKDYIQTLP